MKENQPHAGICLVINFSNGDNEKSIFHDIYSYSTVPCLYLYLIIISLIYNDIKSYLFPGLFIYRNIGTILCENREIGLSEFIKLHIKLYVKKNQCLIASVKRIVTIKSERLSLLSEKLMIKISEKLACFIFSKDSKRSVILRLFKRERATGSKSYI